jgi:hypothetical protein
MEFDYKLLFVPSLPIVKQCVSSITMPVTAEEKCYTNSGKCWGPIVGISCVVPFLAWKTNLALRHSILLPLLELLLWNLKPT